MEDYHKKNYSKLYRKSQFGNREPFIHYKKKYNSHFYNYDEDYFPKKNRINKDFPKTTFNNIYSTEKNLKLTEFNPNVENTEKNNSDKDKEILSNTIIKNRNTTYLEIIPHPKINLYANTANTIPNKNITKNNNEKKNNLINININKNIIQPPHLSPLYQYNLPNYNSNNTNNNINYYYYNFLPTHINNSINNYYINNNIVIYNNNHNSNNNSYQPHYPNLYSILNSYNNIKNMNIMNAINNMNNAATYNYTSQNYYNMLFSKNEEKTKNENIIIDPKKENTCILEISLKLTNDKMYNFKLNRFDDLFETVQIFCQINDLNAKLYIPIIINIMKALNSIYGIFNLKLTQKEIDELQMIKYLCFNSEENQYDK